MSGNDIIAPAAASAAAAIRRDASLSAARDDIDGNFQ